MQEREVPPLAPEAIVELRDDAGLIVRWFCTPEHLDALAAGWLIGEGRAESAGDVGPLEVDAAAGVVRLAGPRTDPRRAPVPVHEGRPRIPDSDPLQSAGTLRAWFGAMFEQGVIRNRSGGVHTGALVVGGELVSVREDVSRHCVVDKLVAGEGDDVHSYHARGRDRPFGGRHLDRPGSLGHPSPLPAPRLMADAVGTLGVLLAGGASRRYGSPKALAEVGGRTLLERSLATLDAAAARTVIVANQPEPFESAGRSVRPDVRPGCGVLGGILTAVTWAAELGSDVALVLACDMPFVPPALARALVAPAGRDRIVVPESDGPRGVEPLCAAYGVDCRDAVTRALDRGNRAVISFFGDAHVLRLPLAAVRAIGDPERMFFNVNDPEERARAEELAASADPAGSREDREG